MNLQKTFLWEGCWVVVVNFTVDCLSYNMGLKN